MPACVFPSKEAGPAPCWPVSLRSFNIDPQPCNWLREEDKGDAGEAGTSQGKGARRGRGAAAEHTDDSEEDDRPRSSAKQLAKKARVSTPGYFAYAADPIHCGNACLPSCNNPPGV